jgi:hypothetical protein
MIQKDCIYHISVKEKINTLHYLKEYLELTNLSKFDINIIKDPICVIHNQENHSNFFYF